MPSESLLVTYEIIVLHSDICETRSLYGMSCCQSGGRRYVMCVWLCVFGSESECGIGARGEPEGAITREVNHQAECWPGTLLTLPEPTRNLSFTLSVCGGLSSPILGRQHSKNHPPPLKTILSLSNGNLRIWSRAVLWQTG